MFFKNNIFGLTDTAVTCSNLYKRELHYILFKLIVRFNVSESIYKPYCVDHVKFSCGYSEMYYFIITLHNFCIWYIIHSQIWIDDNEMAALSEFQCELFGFILHLITKKSFIHVTSESECIQLWCTSKKRYFRSYM